MHNKVDLLYIPYNVPLLGWLRHCPSGWNDHYIKFSKEQMFIVCKQFWNCCILKKIEKASTTIWKIQALYHKNAYRFLDLKFQLSLAPWSTHVFTWLCIHIMAWVCFLHFVAIYGGNVTLLNFSWWVNLTVLESNQTLAL